jgi:hypothetical protein
MKAAAFVCAAPLVIALAGCSDPKAATKSNFENAIQSWIGKNPPCFTVPSSPLRAAAGEPDGGFPRYVDARPAAHPARVEAQAKEAAPFEALAQSGLLSASDTEIEVRAGFFGDGTAKVPVKAYQLTEKGKAAVSMDGQKTAFSVPSPQFCYGVPTIDEIVQFTEPGEMMGVKVSQVAYRYHLKDLPDWAKNAVMQSAFPQLKKNVADSLEGKTAVVLTNDGWVHERAAKL